MHVIFAQGVNDAWYRALVYMEKHSVRTDSRNGPVRVVPWPVATVYSHPEKRVLFDPQRDANPIFHLHEALWMLAGRSDATWLDQFVKDFSSRYGEEGGNQHGAYGRRWRDWFVAENDDQDGAPERYQEIDQLDEVVRLLRENPLDRQAVIQMWDATRDLGVPGLKDRPCNTQIYLRCDREGPKDRLSGEGARFLDMTVMCRSNDVVWGCYGANVVHMSILQEYLAARIGVEVGTYTQMSNNWHLYESSERQANPVSAKENWRIVEKDGYPQPERLVNDPETFDFEVRAYVEDPSQFQDGPMTYCKNGFLKHVALPMWEVNGLRKSGRHEAALMIAEQIGAADWRQATIEWLRRRRR